MNDKVCPLCKNKKGRLYLKNVSSWDIFGSFNYLKCNNCGLIYLSSLPKKSILKKYYKNLNYWGVTKSSNKTRSENIRKTDKDYSYIYNCINLHKSNKVLDIGMGTGLFLYGLKKRGMHVLGVEVNEKIRRYAKKVFDIDSISVEKLNTKDFKNQYDLISLNNVIEHLPNPFLFLKKIKTLLNSNGKIIIVTPNSNSIGFRIFKQKWYHLDPGRHIYIFNDQNIKSILKRSGFKVKVIKHGYFLHNYSGIFESIRHNFKKLRSNHKGKIIHSKDKKKTNNNLKSLFILSVKIFSYLIAKIEEIVKRADVILVYADKVSS